MLLGPVYGRAKPILQQAEKPTLADSATFEAELCQSIASSVSAISKASSFRSSSDMASKPIP